MPLVRHKQGGTIEVGDRAAENLVASGFWTRVDSFVREERVVQIEPAQSHANASKPSPEGGDTQDLVLDAPRLPEAPEEASGDDRPDVGKVRAWAKANNIEVSAKGRVSADVYEKYAEAHKN